MEDREGGSEVEKLRIENAQLSGDVKKLLDLSERNLETSERWVAAEIAKNERLVRQIAALQKEKAKLAEENQQLRKVLNDAKKSLEGI